MSRSAAARIAEAAAVRPSARQLAWQQREFYGFIHFGMNTMTDREWGSGHEDPALFDPEEVDPAHWVAAAESAGMRGLILTCKHHDGFALWPSAHSAHTVAASPWRGGGGDLVRETAEACAAAGLAFGVYLSPWDRTEATYGSGAAYDDFFVAQLTELLTDYGPIFSVWLDGANGEGADGRTQYYDWERYYQVVRRLQPDAVISVCGPDVRWCGNEAGRTRADEWSVVPASLRDAERIASRSQQADDGEFSRLVRSDEDDLGSRDAITAVSDELIWYPAEVNTSIRPGWFHHPSENHRVRRPEEVWTPSENDPAPSIRIRWDEPVTIDGVMLAEDITRGQQIDEVVITGLTASGVPRRLAQLRSVGYRRIVDVPAQPITELIVQIDAARGPVTLSGLAALRPSDLTAS
ncbi:alpha-L-fucosidase [Microbacterium sp.]|uniref:alpha-L-fucosidase n=1 Tax=Microbacterium sp. TaxID=51671 RepID=UPI0027338862|nr:alpha-L-fucosidase [Microbacterium sp.]MDP3952169.1 alpha-L-fucosidase [Microbacterium sp.]